MKMMSKILSLVLVFSMLVSLLPATVITSLADNVPIVTESQPSITTEGNQALSSNTTSSVPKIRATDGTQTPSSAAATSVNTGELKVSTSDNSGGTFSPNDAKSQLILEVAKEYGEKAATDIVETMIKMGIIDADGNKLTYKIIMDGNAYTLDEMREIVNAPSVDLSKKVMVDDQETTLENIAKLISYDDLMKFIDDKFVNNTTKPSEEQIKNMDSIEKQLVDDGLISQNPSANSDQGTAQLLGDSAQLFATSYSTNITASSVVFADNADSIVYRITFTLSSPYVVNTNPYVCKYTTIDGELVAGTGYDAKYGVITFPADSANNATQTVDVKVYKSSITNRFKGIAECYVMLYDPENCMYNNKIWQIITLQSKPGNFTYVSGIHNSTSYDFSQMSVVDKNNVPLVAFDDDPKKLRLPTNGNEIWIKVKRPSNYLEIKAAVEDNIFTDFRMASNLVVGDYYSGNLTTMGFSTGAGETPFWSSDVNDSFYIYGFWNDGHIDTIKNWLDGTGSLWQYVKYVNYNSSVVPYVNTQWATGMLFEDRKDPTLQDTSLGKASAPDFVYKYAMTIPLVTTYSEPINYGAYNPMVYRSSDHIRENPIRKPNNYNNGENSICKRVSILIPYSAYYPSNRGLYIDSVGGYVRDIYDKPVSDYYCRKNIGRVGYYFGDSFSGYGKTYTKPYNTTSCDFSLALAMDNSAGDNPGMTYEQERNAWLTSDISANGDGTTNSIYASVDGGVTRIPLKLNEVNGRITELVGKLDVSPNTGTTDQIYDIELFRNVGTSAAPRFIPVFEALNKPRITITPFVKVKDTDITITYPATYPSGTDSVLTLGDDSFVQLNYTVSGTGTHKTPADFFWKSSDDSIATIDASTGVVTPQSVGKVNFTLFATNGSTDPIDYTQKVTKEFTVEVGLDPSIAVPMAITKIGSSAKVLWSTNIIYLNQNNVTPPVANTQFKVELFAGNYDKTTIVGKTPTVTYNSPTIPVNATSFEIPADKLIAISVGTTPAYTVRVTGPFAGSSTRIVEALGYIAVTPKPANVTLTKPDNLYRVDTQGNITVNWTSSNLDTTNGYDFLFEVYKNGVSTPITTSKSANGTYTINVGTVSGVKDVYTFNAKVKNNSDTTGTYSNDSFVLSVYNSNALKIWIDGRAPFGSSLNLDNTYIKGQTSEQIVALNRKIDLAKNMSINYRDFNNLSIIADQMKWESTNNSAAGIFYSAQGSYENVNNLNYGTYSPNVSFVLSGMNDGQTTINATHNLTQLKTTLNVNVKTLKDKLYLFQIMPHTTADVTYTNGDGVEKSLKTNNKGAVAIYEEKGIIGDVKFKGNVGSDTYVGTIYNYNLVSGENDITKGLLYPINNIAIRKMASVDLVFLKPDGAPYNGKVTLRGGVYKNGMYCQNTGFGGAGITVTPVNGKYTHLFSVADFWSSEAGENALTPVITTDNFEYVFEAIYENNTFLPQFIKKTSRLADTDIVRFAENVVNMQGMNLERVKPFIASSYLDRGKSNGRLDDALYYNGTLGISKEMTGFTITTQVIWWGSDPTQAEAKVIVTNDIGKTPDGQSYKTSKYPFASMQVTDHKITVDARNIWVFGDSVGALTLNLHNNNGVVIQANRMPFAVRNFMFASSVANTPETSNYKEELVKNIKVDTSMPTSDKLLNGMFKIIGDISLATNMFTLLISPTEDPTVFNGLAQVNLGEDVMDMGSSEDGFSLMLNEDSTDSNGATKSAFDRSRGLISNIDDTYSSLKKMDFKKTVNKIKDGMTESDNKFSYQASGYFACRIQYNFDTQKWEYQTIGGGVRVGAGYTFSKSTNAMVGVVPVTFEIALGAAASVEFDAHRIHEPVPLQFDSKYYANEWKDPSTKSVTDYRTALRIKAFMYAFGGIGFDISIIALKVGLFGQLTVENDNVFLNRNYLKDGDEQYKAQPLKSMNGQSLKIIGEVGIKFVAKLLCFTYENTFASASFSKTWVYKNWDYIGAYWKESKGEQLTLLNIDEAALNYAQATGQTLTQYSQGAKLESRGYLSKYERIWIENAPIELFALDTVNVAPTALQTNAYPYANPQIANDGSMFVYLSDNNSASVWDTTVNFATKNASNVYEEKGKINNDITGFGDSMLSFDGNTSTGVATWVRLTNNLEKNSDDSLTIAEQTLITNSTEVLASVYKGGTWTTNRLSTNATPDLAPVVATNGTNAIVAWRSVFSADTSNPANFSAQDYIVYRIYNGTSWGDAKLLYNGISGKVAGLQATMLSNGTAAIVYTLNATNATDTLGYETVYSVVSPAGDVIKNTRLSTDSVTDENPQITTVKFDATDERFIIGWHRQDADNSDIRLATFDGLGNLKNDFVDSLHDISNGSQIGSNFKFVRTNSTNKDFSNLSLIWPQTSAVNNSDTLYGVKFAKDINGRYYTSAALDLADMPTTNDGKAVRTQADSFDAYVSGTNQVKAIILGTESDDSSTDVFVGEDGDGNPTNIYVPRTVSKMYTATENYINKAVIVAADYNYTEIKAGFSMPVAFTVANQGKDPIKNVAIKFAGVDVAFDLTANVIMPGTTRLLTIMYLVPTNGIVDVPYSGNATFTDNGVIILEGAGTSKFAIADLGISKAKVVSEQDGQRIFSVSLYNASDYKLKSAGKKVMLGIYDDSAYTTDSEIVPKITIESTDVNKLDLIDNGAYTAQFTFDLGKYLDDNGYTEIPAGGLVFFVKAWTVDSSNNEITEYVGNNNFSSIVCDNLIARAGGNSVKVNVDQTNSPTQTTAELTLKNLSMKTASNINIAINLLDNSGNIIATKLFAEKGQSLITMEREQVIKKSFVFDNLGASVEARYYTVSQDDQDGTLATISMTGVSLTQSVNAFTGTTSDLAVSNITAMSSNNGSTVTLLDKSGAPLATGIGSVSFSLPLVYTSNNKVVVPGAENSFIIKVTPFAGDAIQTYTIIIANDCTPQPSLRLESSYSTQTGWYNGNGEVSAIAKASNVSTSVLKYKINDGGWNTANDFDGSVKTLNSFANDGEYTVYAKLVNTLGFESPTTPVVLRVDKTKPVFTSTLFSTTAQPLSLMGIDEIRLMSISDPDVIMTVNATDATSGIRMINVNYGTGSSVYMKNEATSWKVTIPKTALFGTLNIEITDYAGNAITQNLNADAPTTGTVTAVSTATGITATKVDGLEYSINGTDWYDTNLFSGLTSGTPYTVSYRVKATENLAASDIQTIAIQTQPLESEISINYLSETVDFGSKYEVSSQLDFSTLVTTGGAITTGTTLYARTKAVAGYSPSEYISINIPVRPSAPEANKIDESVSGRNDGKINGVTTAMEFYNNGVWRIVTLNEQNDGIASLTPSNYALRIAATSSSFVGTQQDITINEGVGKTYTLNITAPTFDDVTYGDAQPVAKTIIITSTGNTNSTISKVELTGSYVDSFTIGTGDSNVPYGTSINTWTISPKDKLAKGIYNATIVVTYNNNATATANVSIKVDAKTVGITWVDVSNLVYKATPYTITATPTGLVGTDTADFTYSNNVATSAGNYTASVVTVTNSNYKLPTVATLNYTINKATYNMSSIGFANASFTFDGISHTLAITGSLPTGVTVAYENNSLTNVGIKTVTAKFSGDATNFNSISDKTATLTVTAKALADTMISNIAAPIYYTGLPITPSVTLTYGAIVLVPCSVNHTHNGTNCNNDYYLVFENNTNAGTAKITAYGIGNYSGTATKTFEILPLMNMSTDVFSTPYSGTYDRLSHGISVSAPTGATITYGLASGTYDLVNNPTYTNSGIYTIYYKVSKLHYLDVVGSKTITITPKSITVINTLVNSKIYDGNTTATFTTAPALSGVIAGDTVILTNGVPTFDSKNIGTNKLVSFTQFAISGAQSTNYSLMQPSAVTSSVTIKQITINGLTAGSKVYNGNTVATIIGTPVLSANYDGANLGFTSGNATFDNKNVGTSKTVTFSNYQLTGSEKDNYSLTQPSSVNADITQRDLVVTSSSSNKIYDGNTTATVSFADNRVLGDAFDISGTSNFDSKNVGIGKTVTTVGITLTGVDANNYLPNIHTTTTADVAPKLITVSANLQTKIINDSDPVLTYEAPLLLEGDQFSGSLTRDVGETAGLYKIYSTLENPDYSINFESSFVIIKNKADDTAPTIPTGGITGSVAGNNGKVTVVIKYGNKLLAQNVLVAAPYTYQFKAIADGYYNITATDGNSTKTIFVEVKDGTITQNSDITLNGKTVLVETIGDDTPNIAVSGNLEDEISIGENISLVITKTETPTEIINIAGNSIIPLNINFTIKKNGNLQQTYTTANLITIQLPLPTSAKGRGIKVYRLHGFPAVAKEMPIGEVNKNSDGEYVEIGKDYLILRVKNFSEYAIAVLRSSGGSSDIITNESFVKQSIITLKLSQDNSTIYYTIDGTKPTKDSTKYEVPIVVTKDTIIKYIEVGKTVSSVVTKNIKVQANTAKLIEKAGETRYIRPTTETEFEPEKVISRYVVIESLYRLLDFAKHGDVSSNFPDVKDDIDEAVAYFQSANIIDGFEDGTFKGEQGLTRAEFVKIMATILKLDVQDGKSTFSDMSGHWSENYVAEFAKFGYLKGYEDGTFMPDIEMIRAEFVAIVNRIIKAKTPSVPPMFDDLPSSYWAYCDIMAAYKSN